MIDMKVIFRLFFAFLSAAGGFNFNYIHTRENKLERILTSDYSFHTQ